MAEHGSAKLPGPGDIVGGTYRLERLLGQGGMGAVYAARHVRLGNAVAIKLMLAAAGNVEATQRFLNEGRAAVHIQHDNVVRGTDVNEENGYAFMVLELLDGEDLDQVLEREIRLAPHVAVNYVIQALRGIGQAHTQGIIHRDLKPANLFLARRPDGTTVVKVLDFGISKATGGSALAMAPNQLTSTATMLGSPLYMSPEQLRSSKKVDSRADIWAVGVILYELITGERPFNGDTLGELFSAILETDALRMSARVPTVAPGLDAIVARCLQRRPEDRYQTAAELEHDLAPYASLAISVGSMGAGAAVGSGVTMALDAARAPHPSGAFAPASTGPSLGGPMGVAEAVTGAHAPSQFSPSGSASSVSGTGPNPVANPPQMLGTVPLGAMSPHPGSSQRLASYQQTTGSGSAWQTSSHEPAPKASKGPIVFLAACGLVLLLGGGAFVAVKAKKAPVAAASHGVPSDSSPTGVAAPPAPADTGAASAPGSAATAAAVAPVASAASSTAGVAPVAPVAPTAKHHTTGTAPTAVKPAEPPKPVEPVKPAEPPKPVEVKPAEPPKPVATAPKPPASAAGIITPMTSR